MDYTECQDPQAFLTATRPILERNEALHGLMLGLLRCLVEDPLHYGSAPFMATCSRAGTKELIALMTPPHKLQLAAFTDDPLPGLTRVAAALRLGSWPVPAVLAERSLAERFAAEWLLHTAGSSEVGMRQRIYELRSITMSEPAPGGIRLVRGDDAATAIRWTHAFHDECHLAGDPDRIPARTEEHIARGDLHFWEDAGPVSMAGYTRSTARGICVGCVYTPPECRRRGYASALVAALSGQALESGKEFCTLYTDLSNPTSNDIYQRIGYRPVADVVDVNFIDPK